MLHRLIPADISQRQSKEQFYVIILQNTASLIPSKALKYNIDNADSVYE